LQIIETISFKSRILHIFVLVSLAVSAPLYEVFIVNSQFFLEYSSSPADIFLFVFTLSILLPSLLALILMVATNIEDSLGKFVYFLISGVLVSLFFLQYLNSLLNFAAWVIVFFALAMTLLWFAVYLKFKHFRTFISFLGFLCIASPISFLLSPTIHQLVFPQVVSINAVNGKTDLPNVVFMVFDELPILSLLDADGRVDALRFPNFSQLVESSHWFINTATVACGTRQAVPAILTGNRPRQKTPAPLAENYPNNLFTLIAGKYDYVNVHEKLSHLCPEKICSLDTRRIPLGLWKKYTAIFSDVIVVYLSRVLPIDFSGFLPVVGGKWANFTKISPGKGELIDKRKARIENFINSITSKYGSSFNFLHGLLPHRVWTILPSGFNYNGHIERQLVNKYKIDGKTGAKKRVKKQWVLDEPLLKIVRQQHLLQLAYLDKMIGQLIKRLKSLDVYEKSLLIITADHGFSMSLNEEIRNFSKSNLGETLFVPWFIKLPYQDTPFLHPELVETIDIYPTLAKILGVPLDSGTDGVAQLPVSSTRKSSVLTRCSGKFTKYEFEHALALREEAHAKQIILFDLKDPGRTLFSFGPLRGLIGKPIIDLNQIAIPIEATISDLELYSNVDLKKRFVPAYIEGKIVGDAPETARFVAIALNGIVQATAEIYEHDGQKKFAGLVSKNSFKSGNNEIQIFLIKEALIN